MEHIVTLMQSVNPGIAFGHQMLQTCIAVVIHQLPQPLGLVGLPVARIPPSGTWIAACLLTSQVDVNVQKIRNVQAARAISGLQREEEILAERVTRL